MTMVPGVHDIPVPPDNADVVVPQVLVVPLLAFDRQGYRLGYGGGFYDRTLEALRGLGGAVTAIGFAFAGQEVESVPRESFDQPLDIIVTEAETIHPVTAMTAD
jgi:5-formyltetrahydrofolate cyclo-ligase